MGKDVDDAADQVVDVGEVVKDPSAAEDDEPLPGDPAALMRVLDEELAPFRILKGIEKEGRIKNYLLGRALSIGAKSYAGGIPLWDRPMDLFLSRTVRPKIAARFGGRIKAMAPVA